ncbi:MAG: hypothetical protein ABIP55_04810 [Tepidisphaeraceae bacterium]
MKWRTRVTDKLRELMLPTLTICIVGSIWTIGYMREKEAEIATRFGRPVLSGHPDKEAIDRGSANVVEPAPPPLTSVSE